MGVADHRSSPPSPPEIWSTVAELRAIKDRAAQALRHSSGSLGEPHAENAAFP
jgi:hypothetical protein